MLLFKIFSFFHYPGPASAVSRPRRSCLFALEIRRSAGFLQRAGAEFDQGHPGHDDHIRHLRKRLPFPSDSLRKIRRRMMGRFY